MKEADYLSKAERTRQFIIEKTAPIFNVKGYAATSLSDMTEATSLTKGSIYGNFADKDEVALAAFDHNLKKIGSILAAEMRKVESYEDKLLVYTHVYKDFLNYPFPEGGCPILNTAIEADDTHPGLKKAAMAAMLQWKNSIVKLINKGIDRGEFKAGVNAEAGAVTMVAMIEGSVMLTKLMGKKEYMNYVQESISALIKSWSIKS